jgi:hypothetical protein
VTAESTAAERDGAGPAGGRAAELMAAVRAVERGEAAATEFFNRPGPPPSCSPPQAIECVFEHA